MEGDKLMVNIVGNDPVIPVLKQKRGKPVDLYDDGEHVRKRFCLQRDGSLTSIERKDQRGGI